MVVYNTRREAELTLSRKEQIELTRFVGGVRGFVCLHISGCRPENWHEYHDVSGGSWITGTSTNPSYGQFTVNISDSGHICSAGIRDFITNDELYIELGLNTGNQVIMAADLGGQMYPMTLTRFFGNGKVFQTTWVAFSRLCFSN